MSIIEAEYPIGITLTKHEWRLLAIAATKVNSGSYISLDDARAVRKLAKLLLQEIKA